MRLRDPVHLAPEIRGIALADPLLIRQLSGVFLSSTARLGTVGTAHAPPQSLIEITQNPNQQASGR
jgi:hypothetical protein